MKTKVYRSAKRKPTKKQRVIGGCGLSYQTMLKLLEESYINPHHRVHWAKSYQEYEKKQRNEQYDAKKAKRIESNLKQNKFRERTSRINDYYNIDNTAQLDILFQKKPEMREKLREYKMLYGNGNVDEQKNPFGTLYYNPWTNHLTLTHRGTVRGEDNEDWFNNFTAFNLVHHPVPSFMDVQGAQDWPGRNLPELSGVEEFKTRHRYKAAKSLQQQAVDLKKALGANLTVLGHSQGAYLAYLLNREQAFIDQNAVDETIMYNPMAIFGVMNEAPLNNEFIIGNPTDCASGSRVASIGLHPDHLSKWQYCQDTRATTKNEVPALSYQEIHANNPNLYKLDVRRHNVEEESIPYPAYDVLSADTEKVLMGAYQHEVKALYNVHPERYHMLHFGNPYYGEIPRRRAQLAHHPNRINPSTNKPYAKLPRGKAFTDLPGNFNWNNDELSQVRQVMHPHSEAYIYAPENQGDLTYPGHPAGGQASFLSKIWDLATSVAHPVKKGTGISDSHSDFDTLKKLRYPSSVMRHMCKS
jgi:hypothetical protein